MQNVMQSHDVNKSNEWLRLGLGTGLTWYLMACDGVHVEYHPVTYCICNVSDHVRLFVIDL